MKFLAMVAFFFGVIYLKEPNTFWSILWGVVGVLFVIFLLIVAYSWLTNSKSQDVDALKRQSGKDAEKYVQNLLNQHFKKNKNIHAVLHNKLFVFNRGESNEFSTEVDHIYIGQNNIYLIETKYKSGEIRATADAKDWQTANGEHVGSMRNALTQAKNAARVLNREIDLPVKLVPMVAIHGSNVSLSGNPSNVVVADDLIKTIEAFELAQQPHSRLAKTCDISSIFLSKCSDKKDDMSRHIARANAKAEKHKSKAIVESASLN